MRKYQHITARQVVEQIIDLATTNPTFVYTDQPERKTAPETGEDINCSYVGAYIPSIVAERRRVEDYVGQGCIVGQALARLGVSTEDLIEADGTYATAVLDDLEVGGLRVRKAHPTWGDYTTTSPEGRFIDSMQSLQDNGHSWGEALDMSRRHYEGVAA